MNTSYTDTFAEVTVIINVYNGAQTIARALDSLTTQAVLPSRIIVWDNQSDDATSQIVSLYSSVDYYLAPQHTSLGEARELARSLVRTTWVAYLDADDYWYPNKLKDQSPFLCSNVGVIYSSVEERTVNGHLIRVINPVSPTGYQIDDLLHKWNISLVTALINNDLINSLDLSFDSQCIASEEQDLIMQLACVSPFVSIPVVHGCIVVSNNSLTNKSLFVLGDERRRLLSKLRKKYPYSFSESAFSSSLDQSCYYDALYLMSVRDYAQARCILFRISKSSHLFYLLYCISFFPPLWSLLHSRPIKSAITSFLRF